MMSSGWLISLVLAAAATTSFSQPAVFTYQGRLLDKGQPASGSYAFRLALTDAVTNGHYVGPAITNGTVITSNGLFTVAVDFGSAVFDGTPLWLEVGVRTNCVDEPFALLSPSQPLNATPVANFVAIASDLIGGGLSLTNVPAASLTGMIPVARISGLTSNQFDAGTDAVYRGRNDLAAATNVFGSAIGKGFNLSVNTANLPHLQRALNANRSVRILWLGDSIGDNTAEAVFRLFERYSVDGIQRGGPFGYKNRYWASLSAVDTVPSVWWVPDSVVVQQDGESVVWGGPLGGYNTADTLQFWYLASPTNGTATLATSADGINWTTRGVVDESNATPVLLVTNICLPRGLCSTRVSASGRIQYLWPALLDSSSSGAILSVCNSGGRQLADFLAMGTESIATLLTNLRPDLIVYEQKKDVWTRSNWPAVKAMFDTYAGGADVCLLPGQISNGPTDYPVPNATNSSLAVALLDRSIAVSNRWAFVDDYTPLNDWPSIVANVFAQDNLVHLNILGKLFAGSVMVRELGLLDYLFSAGLGRAP